MGNDETSTAYDRIAQQWQQAPRAFTARRHVDELLRLCPRQPRVLDLGCGTGIPVTRYLLDRGCRVTGVDASARMLELAGTNVPEARLHHGDMLGFASTEQFEAIVAWDCVFHVPRASHAMLFSLMRACRGIAQEGCQERAMVSAAAAAKHSFVRS